MNVVWGMVVWSLRATGKQKGVPAEEFKLVILAG